MWSTDDDWSLMNNRLSSIHLRVITQVPVSLHANILSLVSPKKYSELLPLSLLLLCSVYLISPHWIIYIYIYIYDRLQLKHLSNYHPFEEVAVTGPGSQRARRSLPQNYYNSSVLAIRRRAFSHWFLNNCIYLPRLQDLSRLTIITMTLGSTPIIKNRLHNERDPRLTLIIIAQFGLVCVFLNHFLLTDNRSNVYQ